VTPAHPRIVLVGGAPAAGKTTLARALAARMGAPTQTFDSVVTAIRAVTSPGTHRAFHAGRSSYVEYFTEGSPARLIRDALRLEQACWPAIEQICAPSRAGETGLVMDWWLLPPRDLATTDVPGLAGLWIEIDRNALEQRERANESFFAASDDPIRMFENFMARSLWANEHYASQARQFGFPVLEQPGDRPTEDLVDEAIVALTKQRSTI
jgi:2-phosphoglycerate kinase